jgi:hypothetical protein
MGVGASLQGFVLTDILKQAQSATPFLYRGGLIRVVKKTKIEALDSVFHELITCPGRYVFVCFSDDSCLAIRINGQIHRFNCDISKCDASHRHPLFISFRSLFPPRLHRDVDVLLEQTLAPIKIRCPGTRHRVVIQPDDYILPSGSTLTTAINNLASMTIGMAIADADITCAADIIRASARAGYILTLDICEIVEDLQFLKHSPVFAHNFGDYRAVMNPAVLFRCIGRCRGDLPPSRDFPSAAAAFNKALLNGIFPLLSTPYIDALRESFSSAVVSTTCESVVRKILEHKVTESSRIVITTDEDLFRRYRVTQADILEHSETVSLGFGFNISTRVSRAAFLKDYSLPCA